MFTEREREAKREREREQQKHKNDIIRIFCFSSRQLDTKRAAAAAESSKHTQNKNYTPS